MEDIEEKRVCPHCNSPLLSKLEEDYSWQCLECCALFD
jgi:ribosomal protein L37AE/L43A